MTPDQAQVALDLLKRSSEDIHEALNRAVESHFDHGDRAIAQLAQLVLLDSGPTVETLRALKEVATSGGPL